jgi:hypothetical protein
VMQLSDRHDGPSRAVIAHDSTIGFIHSSPQRDVRYIDRHLERVIQPTPGGFKNGLDVLERLLRLRLDGAWGRPRIGRIDPQLSGYLDHTIVNNRMRVMPCRSGCGRGDDRLHDFTSPFSLLPISSWDILRSLPTCLPPGPQPRRREPGTDRSRAPAADPRGTRH